MTDAQRNDFNMVERAVESLRAGKLVIVVDAAERENEGDFICAAETITPEQVHFMLSVGRGVFCTPMSMEVADRLDLRPMVQEDQNTAPHGTPMLIPIDHRDAGTGVSPESRALTAQKLADPKSTPAEFLRPGHVNPLFAKDGGVLRRAGHTEATVDLMRLSGHKPVGCLIEICSRTGKGMAKLDELLEIGAEHDIPIISIEELIRYRRVREQLIHREAEVEIPTGQYGNPTLIGYRVEHESQEPLAIVWGDLKNPDKPPLVRMHSSCFTGDLLDSLRCDCGDQLHLAMKSIYEQGSGRLCICRKKVVASA